MAQATYLSLVNKVLKKLREDPVPSIGYSKYSALIGEFVNDAKREVEDAWLWAVNRRAVSFTASGTASTYDLSTNSTLATLEGTRTTSRSVLLYDKYSRPMAFETTANDRAVLSEMAHEDMEHRHITDPDALTQNTQPGDFSIRPDFDGDGFVVTFWGTPSAGRTYRFHFYTPQEDLVANEDVLTIPGHLVVHLALIYALDERGEEIGEPGSKAMFRYNQALSDAISLDARKDPHLTTFVVP